MKKINNKQTEKFIEQAKTYMNMKNEGKTAEQIMADLYLEAFEAEGHEAAAKAAAEALKTAKEFASAYKKAVSDLESFIDEFQNTMDEGKTDEEKCAYWLKFIAAVTVAGMNDAAEEERKAVYDQIAGRKIDAITPEIIEGLRAEACRLMMNNNIMVINLEGHAQELSKLADGDEAAAFLMSVNGDEIELRAIAAMLAHIQIKQGAIKGIPADTPIALTATMISAVHERIKIFNRVSLGEITEKTAYTLLNILGIAVMTFLAIFINVIGISVLLEVIETTGLMIFALVMLGYAVFTMLRAAIDLWSDEAKVIAKVSVTALSWVVNGMRKVLGCMAKAALPKMTELGKVVSERVSSLMNNRAQDENTKVQAEVIA